MAYRYKLHELAHEEYINAYVWYEIKQNGLGDRFMSSVEACLKQISNHPEYYSKKQGDYRSVKVKISPLLLYMNILRESNLYILLQSIMLRENQKESLEE